MKLKREGLGKQEKEEVERERGEDKVKRESIAKRKIGGGKRKEKSKGSEYKGNIKMKKN